MVCHSLNNNTRTGLVESLSLNTNPLIGLIPRITSNFRHLLSCGTIACYNFFNHLKELELGRNCAKR